MRFKTSVGLKLRFYISYVRGQLSFGFEIVYGPKCKRLARDGFKPAYAWSPKLESKLLRLVKREG